MKKDKREKLHFDEKTKIMVTGIGEDVGATTVSTCLAFYLAEQGMRTGFLQLAPPTQKALHIYYQFFMDKADQWDSFYQAAIEGKPIKRCFNLMHQVNWAIRLPQDGTAELALAQASRLAHGIGGQAIVCLCAPPYDCPEILTEGDLILAVVDPMPYKVMANMEKIRSLKKLELDGYKVVWIANKMNKGVHFAELRKAIKVGNIFPMEWLDPKELYSCQYRGISINKAKNVKTKFKELFDNIFNNL